VNMAFYTKNYLIETDEKYHLVLPFYASGTKLTAILFMEAIFNSFSEWNVINQDGTPVASSCTVLKETKKIKLKYWDKLNTSKDLELKEGIVYFLLGSSHDLKQNLMQGRTNYLVFSQTKEKHEKIEGTVFGLLYGVYLINDESDYITLKSYFQK
ncbi:MAG: hypothetical protein P1P88_19185, partial [Bacteroidales bacterium]|nr:hypothetical protein [Bacteroidales bacterium]